MTEPGSVWSAPIAIAALGAAGLALGLVANGVLDAAASGLVGAPIAVLVWAWLRRGRGARPRKVSS
jgi:hypothetical protein